MKVLRRGAEATIYESVFDGQKVLVKERPAKRYRIPQIDARLRSERTRQEIKLLREARGRGLLTPKVVHSDEESSVIVMEKIEGELAKDFLSKSKSPWKMCRRMGEEIGKMHSFGIIHGDLTTSNMILDGDRVHMIDFGLGYFSKRVEDMATDLRVLREVLTSTHHRISGRCWSNVASGYRTNPSRDAVMLRMGEIESRGRYKKKE